MSRSEDGTPQSQKQTVKQSRYAGPCAGAKREVLPGIEPGLPEDTEVIRIRSDNRYLKGISYMLDWVDQGRPYTTKPCLIGWLMVVAKSHNIYIVRRYVMLTFSKISSGVVSLVKQIWWWCGAVSQILCTCPLPFSIAKAPLQNWNQLKNYLFSRSDGKSDKSKCSSAHSLSLDRIFFHKHWQAETAQQRRGCDKRSRWKCHVQFRIVRFEPWPYTRYAWSHHWWSLPHEALVQRSAPKSTNCLTVQARVSQLVQPHQYRTASD